MHGHGFQGSEGDAPVIFTAFIRTLNGANRTVGQSTSARLRATLRDPAPERRSCRRRPSASLHGRRSHHLHETMLYENPADIPAGKNAQPSQRRPRRGSHRLRGTGVCRLARAEAVSKNKASASARLLRASDTESPWPATSTSGHRATYPPPSRSRIAVNRLCISCLLEWI